MAYEGDYLGRMQRITYPDDEVVTYGYDRGGQIKSVTGRRFTTDFNYVVDVAYDEYGQRSYIEYGNGVRTTYVYDAYRRWLKSIETEYSRNGNSIEYQNIVYQFDAVGNVLGYENKTNRYETSQTYTYDGLYQLKTANGRTENRSEGLGSCPAYTSTYKQTFEFDSIGNMTKKVSTSAVSPKRTIGAGLNYNYDQYDYYAGFPHRLERVGNMYYRYDGNGNVIAEREGGHATTDSRNATVYNDGDLYYTDYGFGLFQEGQTDTKVYERKYTWNERNLLASSVDRQYAVTYRYGADGQRAAKYAVRGTTSVETMYFNQFWSSRTTATSEMLESKHIFVGTSRVVTKLHRKGDDSVDYEGKNRYYYHSDHLGSAQLVTDFKGLEYERIEYTPYGELWVEKTIAGSERLPFRFTGKEFDEETGLYYYGARYLDPKVSRWLSTDPAVGEYIPSAPVNDEARKRNGNLPGMGGIYNLVNFHLYHYAGNNPVRYIDPDGSVVLPVQNSGNMNQNPSAWYNLHLGNSNNLIRSSGCTAVANIRVINAQAGTNHTPQYWAPGQPGASYISNQGKLNRDAALHGATSNQNNWTRVVNSAANPDAVRDQLETLQQSTNGYYVVALATVTYIGADGLVHTSRHEVNITGVVVNADGTLNDQGFIWMPTSDSDVTQNRNYTLGQGSAIDVNGQNGVFVIDEILYVQRSEN
jgi:RHS repeat-associated protein